MLFLPIDSVAGEVAIGATESVGYKAILSQSEGICELSSHDLTNLVIFFSLHIACRNKSEGRSLFVQLKRLYDENRSRYPRTSHT